MATWCHYFCYCFEHDYLYLFPELLNFSSRVTFHRETTHLICYANQMTGYYMKCNTWVKWVNSRIPSKHFCGTIEEFITFFEGSSNPAGTYLFKVNNGNKRTFREICSKIKIKTSERRHWRRSGVFIVNFEESSRPGSCMKTRLDSVFLNLKILKENIGINV